MARAGIVVGGGEVVVVSGVVVGGGIVSTGADRWKTWVFEAQPGVRIVSAENPQRRTDKRRTVPGQ